MSILIKNITIISGDDIKENKNVFVNDNIISYIGEKSDFKADDVICGKNKIMMPGLINTHTHVAMTALRGYSENCELEKWLFEKIFPAEDRMTEDDAFYISKLSFLEMLASGTTAFCDMYMFVDKIADAAIQSGIRATIARGLQCFEDSDFSNDRRISECLNFHKEYSGAGDGLIKPSFGMHSVYCCTKEYLRYCAKLSKEMGSINHIHLSETQTENDNCIKKYGKTPTQLMYETGVFDVKCIAAHGTHLTPNDMDILKKCGVSVALNPASNLKLKSGIANAKKLGNAKISTAIGTDGASSNNKLDMMSEMRLAALLYGLDAKTAFKMATKGGADAIGHDNIGEIKENMKADFIILNTDSPNFHPVNDYYSNIVFASSSKDIETTVVNGKILYNKGEYMTLDRERIIYEADKICDRICI